MDPLPDLAAIIGSAATPSSLDRAPLTRLVGRCWPAGADTLQPAALEWVRRWGPNRVSAPSAVCGCATRRCGWCN